MTISRRQAREWAVQMLSAADLNPPEDVDAFVEAFWRQLPSLENEEGGIDGRAAKGRMKDFSEGLVRGVLKDMSAIDAELVALLDHWDLYRLGVVERSVLRMGIYEIKLGETPSGIVVNEAVDLVNWFSQPSSRTLVNGVLDRFAKKA